MNKKTSHSVINIGSGKDFNIRYYASFVLKQLDIKTTIVYDKSKPIGTPRKLLDCRIANNYGWYPKTSLEKGISITINDLNKNS